MNQNIIFKNVENKINIMVDPNLSFNTFLKELKNRLDRLYIKDDLLKANVTLDISNINLDSKKILNIFDVFAMYGSIYIDKILYKQEKSKNIILHEGNIRSGEIRLFTTNTLIIGNINKGAKVIINGNLYVIGKVSGNIEFKGINNKLMASNIEESLVKICSFEKHFKGINENVSIKISEDSIVEEKFIDRRGILYGKSNCSYIR